MDASFYIYIFVKGMLLFTEEGEMEIYGDECVYIFPDLLKAVSGTFRR